MNAFLPGYCTTVGTVRQAFGRLPRPVAKSRELKRCNRSNPPQDSPIAPIDSLYYLFVKKDIRNIYSRSLPIDVLG